MSEVTDLAIGIDLGFRKRHQIRNTSNHEDQYNRVKAVSLINISSNSFRQSLAGIGRIKHRMKILILEFNVYTTYSCVAVWESERVEIIANEQGNRTTPSYVAFSEQERLIGDAAKNQAAMNPTNTVFDAKRLIGRRFDDPEVKSDMKHWPFTVIDKESAPFIQVDYQGEKKEFSPQEISAMVLIKMKEIAEAKLGKTVTKAVIT
ncbi:10 kda heat shock protein, partial [Mortierella sp. AD032]